MKKPVNMHLLIAISNNFYGRILKEVRNDLVLKLEKKEFALALSKFHKMMKYKVICLDN